jgi:antagonist of KipI
MDGMNAIVARPGFLTTVQDLGRPGFRQAGVTPGGAIDALAMRIANLLVGNEENHAGLEVTLSGLRLRFSDDRCVAWCGGAFEVKVSESLLPAGRVCFVSAGEELSFGHTRSGCRAWLAISGGIDVPPVLGSRSTDLRGAFGGLEGRVLRKDDRIPLGRLPQRTQERIAGLRDKKVTSWGAPSEWALPGSAKDAHELRVVRGADWSRFSAEAIESFLSQPFTISPDSDRMGVRLVGSALQRSDEGGDLISEAVTPGTIQVPPGGQPILLMADCQTIGGYPKLAHMITVDLPIAAQLRPGDRVRFHEVSMAEAHRLLLQRADYLARFRIGLSLHE